MLSNVRGQASDCVKVMACCSCNSPETRLLNKMFANVNYFFHKHLGKKEIIKIRTTFVEKSKFRGVARATGHHLDTIRSLASDVAEHCEAVTEFLLHDVKLGTHEIDEFWNFVKKNKKMLPTNFSRTLSKAMRTLT